MRKSTNKYKELRRTSFPQGHVRALNGMLGRHCFTGMMNLQGGLLRGNLGVG